MILDRGLDLLQSFVTPEMTPLFKHMIEKFDKMRQQFSKSVRKLTLHSFN